MTNTMIAPMGGMGSANYRKFEDKFVESFKILRNKMNYILNLMFLMINSGIQNLQFGNHQKVLLELYQRFMPDLTNQQIEKVLKKLLQDSIDTSGAETIEFFHNVAQLTK